MSKAKLVYDKAFQVSAIDSRLYGSFVEHLGRCCYGGIYEPDNETADNHGFRNDVKELVKEAGVTGLRYPGGNFVSGYDWKDGIGPKDERPITKNLAWGMLETNEVGTDEFMQYAEDTHTEVYMAVNLASGTPMDAAEQVEYCNSPKGTKWADKRVQNGRIDPYKIKTWCLGNEMDGDWQICMKTPEEYARVCKEAAKLVKWVDPSVEVIACGSCTNEIGHKTFGRWDRKVLEECYDQIDYLSIHRYLNYHANLNLAYPNYNDKTDIPYLFRDLQNYIDAMNGAIQLVKEEKHTDKIVRLSFDEWGVITDTGAVPGTSGQTFGYASFNQMDAVIYGGILCTLLNNADSIKIACQSLLVNEGGMISTDPRGNAIRQTTFYPFRDVAHYGKGIALKRGGTVPQEMTDHHGMQDTILSAAAYDPDSGDVAVFVANCSATEQCDMTLDLRGFYSLKGIEQIELYNDDPWIGNTFEEADRVIPENTHLDDPMNGELTKVLKPHSWNVFRFCAESKHD